MSPVGDGRQARKQIDLLLTTAGWNVCDMGQQNHSACRGAAIRELLLREQFLTCRSFFVASKFELVV